jgi:hypothetical protein
MSITGLLILIVLVCGGRLSIAAVAVVLYLIMNQRDK